MSTDNELKYDHFHIGRAVKKSRKKKEFSTYRLAIESGVSSSVIVRIEKGEREPKINTLLRIINGLGITPAEFFKEFK